MARTLFDWNQVRPWAAIAASGLYGAVLWGSAPVWAGSKEPWDSQFGLYIAALTLGGLLALIAPRRPLAAPAGVVFGQVAWQIATGSGSLWPLAMVMLSILAVPAAAVSVIVWLLDRRKHPRRGPGACSELGHNREGLGARPYP